MYQASIASALKVDGKARLCCLYMTASLCITLTVNWLIRKKKKCEGLFDNYFKETSG